MLINATPSAASSTRAHCTTAVHRTMMPVGKPDAEIGTIAMQFDSPNERLTQESYWTWASVVSHQALRFI